MQDSYTLFGAVSTICYDEYRVYVVERGDITNLLRVIHILCQ